jgi:hypothetical protein
VAATAKIETYSTCARANNKQCRTFSHWVRPVVASKMSYRVFRITDRHTILQDSGFRLLGGTGTNKDFPKPLAAVKNFIDDWASPLAHVLYWTDSCYEINVWGK